MSKKKNNDEFTLYDLRCETIENPNGKPFVCNHPVGSYFDLKGENIFFPSGQSFPLYPLAALLPLLPAKQRETHENDWMTTDMIVACPDPNCGGLFKIIRTGKSIFYHCEQTFVPLNKQNEDKEHT